jgi:hypothetical protein
MRILLFFCLSLIFVSCASPDLHILARRTVQTDKVVKPVKAAHTNSLPTLPPNLPPPPNTQKWVLLNFTNIADQYIIYSSQDLSNWLHVPFMPVQAGVQPNKLPFVYSLIEAMVAPVQFFGVVGVADNNQRVVLAWSDPDPTVTGYNVYRGTLSGIYTSVTDVGNVTSVVIGGLLAGTNYYWAATAYNSNRLEGAFSNQVHIKQPTNNYPIRSSLVVMPKLPQISNSLPISVTSTSAVLTATILSDGGDTPLNMVFFSAVTNAWQNFLTNGIGTGVVTTAISNLLPGKTYYATFASENAAGLAVGYPFIQFVTSLTTPPPTFRRISSAHHAWITPPAPSPITPLLHVEATK